MMQATLAVKAADHCSHAYAQRTGIDRRERAGAIRSVWKERHAPAEPTRLRCRLYFGYVRD